MTDDRIYRVDVAAPAADAWNALIDPDLTRRYYFGTAPRSSWAVGEPIDFIDDDGAVQITGVVLDFDPPRRLAHTFIATWYGSADDQGSLHWEVEPTATGCRITLTHRGVAAHTREGSETAEGSQQIIDGLKELLEAAG